MRKSLVIAVQLLAVFCACEAVAEEPRADGRGFATLEAFEVPVDAPAPMTPKEAFGEAPDSEQNEGLALGDARVKFGPLPQVGDTATGESGAARTSEEFGQGFGILLEGRF